MTKLVDCPTCGGLLPPDRQCCPHCHCKYSGLKAWKLAAAAALGVGAAGCGGSTGTHADMSVVDSGGAVDMSETDIMMPVIEYGPAMIDLGNEDAH